MAEESRKMVATPQNLVASWELRPGPGHPSLIKAEIALMLLVNLFCGEFLGSVKTSGLRAVDWCFCKQSIRQPVNLMLPWIKSRRRGMARRTEKERDAFCEAD